MEHRWIDGAFGTVDDVQGSDPTLLLPVMLQSADVPYFRA
jgi:hypothetical protein